MLAQEIIRHKRDGRALDAREIESFVSGLVDGSWSDSQAAALAMAIVLRGMDRPETVHLTRAMTASGAVLDWTGSGLSGPVLDKHSTGGVGDKVSLMLAPILAACGAVVPMLSGRGLGHTGGTLDKLQAWPGYQVNPSRELMLQCLSGCGCAIVGASEHLAPADRRLYAIRDVTATVESLPLITASILSKKLAAGLQGLVMDVKVGNGAFTPTLEQGRALAHSLVEVAAGSGLPTIALLTDMQQPLGRSAGNALEVLEAIRFLSGQAQDPRLREVTLALSAHLALLGKLARDLGSAHHLVARALDSGSAAEHFARMVATLGGPLDVLREHELALAPVRRDVFSPRAGVLTGIDTRSVGLAVLELGGGRRRPGDVIDPRVGLDDWIPLGSPVQAGQPLAQVYAADEHSAKRAADAVLSACRIEAGPPGPAVTRPVLETIGAVP